MADGKTEAKQREVTCPRSHLQLKGRAEGGPCSEASIREDPDFREAQAPWWQRSSASANWSPGLCAWRAPRGDEVWRGSGRSSAQCFPEATKCLQGPGYRVVFPARLGQVRKNRGFLCPRAVGSTSGMLLILYSQPAAESSTAAPTRGGRWSHCGWRQPFHVASPARTMFS